MMSFPQKQRNRIIGLDILRSIAILLVVFSHGVYLLPFTAYDGYMQFLLPVDGVSVFFVLSGYLIGGILLDTIHQSEFKTNDLLQFWVRRWFRTIPNYLFILIILVMGRLLLFGDLGEFSYLFFLFLQNFYGPHPNFFVEAWSLAVEEWFYLLFPIACFVFHQMLKDKQRSVLYSALIFLLVPLALRIGKFELDIGVMNYDEEFKKITVLRLDSLMYGVIAVYIHRNNPMLWSKFRYLLAFAGVALMVAVKLNSSQDWIAVYKPLEYNIESIMTMLFLPFLSELKTTRFRYFNNLVVFISVISYSMYLLNLTVVEGYIIPLTNLFLGLNPQTFAYGFLINYVLYWVYTIGLAYLLNRFIEVPITNLRDTIKFNTTRSVTVTSEATNRIEI